MLQEKNIVSLGDEILGQIKINPRGFGFLHPLNIHFPNYYIHNDNLKNAKHNDIVKARIVSFKGNDQADVIKVVEKNNLKYVGVAKKHGDVFFVRPISRNSVSDSYFYNTKENRKINDGDIVVCHNENSKTVESIINQNVSNDELIQNILETKYNLKSKYKDLHDIINNEENNNIKNSNPDKRTYDLRDKFTISIDNKSTKDIDDAISIDIEDDKIILYVHIAHVSKHVKEGSIQDKEAYEKGQSVYLKNNTYHMLNDEIIERCSLAEGKDREAITTEVIFDKKGVMKGIDIYSSVINVNFNLNYEFADYVISNFDGKSEVLDLEGNTDLKIISDYLYKFKILSDLLFVKRFNLGIITSNLKWNSEKFQMDNRLYSEKMIEVFMILTNTIIADFLNMKGFNFIYKVQNNPSSDQVYQWINFLNEQDIRIEKESNDYINNFREYVKAIKGLDNFEILIRPSFKAMSASVYSTEDMGHFSLNTRYYTSFTSPIRKYSDLINHRILMNILNNNIEELKINLSNEYMDKLNKTVLHLNLINTQIKEIERDEQYLNIILNLPPEKKENIEGVIVGESTYGINVFIPSLNIITYVDLYYHPYNILKRKFDRIYYGYEDDYMDSEEFEYDLGDEEKFYFKLYDCKEKDFDKYAMEYAEYKIGNKLQFDDVSLNLGNLEIKFNI